MDCYETKYNDSRSGEQGSDMGVMWHSRYAGGGEGVGKWAVMFAFLQLTSHSSAETQNYIAFWTMYRTVHSFGIPVPAGF